MAAACNASVLSEQQGRPDHLGTVTDDIDIKLVDPGFTATSVLAAIGSNLERRFTVGLGPRHFMQVP